MLTDIHDFYHAFMEGLMGSNKAWKFMRKAEIWRFSDAQRLGRMYAMAINDPYKSWTEELDRLRAENARLREALEEMVEQDGCDCGHPACKRCRRTLEARAALEESK